MIPSPLAPARSAGSFDQHGGSARGHHEHPATRAHGNGLIIEIHAYHRVASQPGGLCLHLVQGNVLGLAQLLFVGGGAPPYDVSDTGKHVTKDVGPNMASPLTRPKY